MILVDTSAWVEYDRATGSAVDEQLTNLISTSSDLAVTEPVLMEVLAGARDDPAARGRCQVNRWEYGAPGSADLRTTDVSAYFNSPDVSVTVPMSAVPLHAVVRYPSGIGPFPLVLIVHGNFRMEGLLYRLLRGVYATPR